ncbi:MAG: hypothetical protein V4650_14505 [Pseudomonadota bacterium]
MKLAGLSLGGGTTRKLGSAVIDQAMLSGANFLVGVLLVRYAGDADYGYYVLAQAAILLLAGAQGAWINGPLAVLAPKKTDIECYQMVGAVEAVQARLLRRLAAAALLVPVLGYLLHWMTAEVAMATAATVLACWGALLREYRRAVLQLYGRPHLVLIADVFYVLGLSATAGLAAAGAEPRMVFAVMSLAVGSLLGGKAANYFITKDPGWHPADAAPVFRELRRLGNWAMAGAVIYWTFGQGFNYVVAGQLGVAAVATLNAARLLIQPTFVLTMGIKQALQPMVSRWFHELGLRAVLKRLTAVVLILAVLNLSYLGLVWGVLDWLTNDFLRKNIPDRNALVLLWALHSMVNMVRDMYLSSLMAMERFQVLAGFTALSAFIALAVMWPATAHFGLRGAIYGLIAGELSYSIAMFALIAQVLRRDKAT